MRHVFEQDLIESISNWNISNKRFMGGTRSSWHKWSAIHTN